MAIVAIVMMSAFVAALVIGINLLVRGLRGVPELGEPRCARCGYDLRGFGAAPPTVCSECGSDLSQPRAVRWGDYKRRPRLAWVGVALIALPIVVVVSLAVGRSRTVMAIGPGGKASLSNAALIASLATTVNQPWDWNELTARLQRGALSNAEVTQAIDLLVADLKSRPAANNSGLPWSGQFVNAALLGNAITTPQFLQLAEAYYGPAPTVTVTAAVRVGETVRFQMKYGGYSNMQSVECVTALREVRSATGDVLPVGDRDRRGSQPDQNRIDLDRMSTMGHSSINGQVATRDLPVGEHELTFVVDIGYLAAGTAPQISGHLPGQAHNWPRGYGRVAKEVKTKVRIVPAGTPLLQAVTDPTLDPRSSIKVTNARAVKGNAGEAVIQLDASYGQRGVPLSFDRVVRVNGQDIPMGYVVAQDSSTTTSGPNARVKDLPPDVTTVDVFFRPNPKHAESIPGVDRYWNGEVVVRDVPLKRYDLEATSAMPATTQAAK